jgi:hypothetical protein
MVCVWRGLGPTDGWLVHHWLQAAGIRSELRGAHLPSLAGEVPPTESWPSVWVAERDEGDARRALAEREGPRLVSPEWACGCGEVHAPAFDACWRCGARRA